MPWLRYLKGSFKKKKIFMVKGPLIFFSDYFIIFSKIVYYVNLKMRAKFIINNDFKYFLENYQKITFRFFLTFGQN